MVLGGSTATNFTMDGGSISAGSTTPLTSVGFKSTDFGIVASQNSGSAIDFDFTNALGSLTISNNAKVVAEFLPTSISVFDSVSTLGNGNIYRTAGASGDDFTIELLGGTDSSLVLQSNGTGNDAISINASAGGFDIEGQIASKINVTTGDLDISTYTSGNLTLSTTTAGNIVASSAQAVNVTAVGTFDVQSQNFSIDATGGSSNLSVTGAGLSIQTLTSGTLTLQSAGIMDVNAGTSMDIDVGGAFDMLSTGAFSIDGTGASNVSATSGNLTISTLASGTLVLDSVGLVDLNAGANLDIDVTGTFDVLSSGSFSIDGTGASNVTATSGDLTLSTVTSGVVVLNAPSTVKVQSGGADKVTFGSTNVIFDYQIQASSTGGFKFGAGGQNVTSISTATDLGGGSPLNTTLSTQQAVKTYVDNKTSTLQPYTVLADGSSNTLALGDVVSINSSGQAIKGKANTSTDARVIGVCLSNSGGNVTIAQIGTVSKSGLTAGTTYYLSEATAGALTATAPSTSGNVVFQVGFAKSTTELVIMPNYIMEIG